MGGPRVLFKYAVKGYMRYMILIYILCLSHTFLARTTTLFCRRKNEGTSCLNFRRLSKKDELESFVVENWVFFTFEA